MRRVLFLIAFLLLPFSESHSLATRIQLVGVSKDRVTVTWRIRGANPRTLRRAQLEIQNKNPYTNRFELAAIVLSPAASGVVVAPLRLDTSVRAKVLFKFRRPSLSNVVDVPPLDEEGDDIVDDGGLIDPPDNNLDIPAVPYSVDVKDGRSLCDQRTVAETLRALNSARESMGLPALAEDAILSRAALAHSNWQAEASVMSHEGWFERYLLSGGDLGAVAQNIAKAVTDSSDLANGWLQSPSHRGNILSEKYSKTGLSCVADKSGVYYWSHYFGA